jgi:putative hemin transport protein
MTPITVTVPENLKAAWAKLREEKPNLRIRDAAIVLNVSEAELLATGAGETVTRLDPKFPDILKDLHRLGRVMALTRNNEIVHERKGEYKNVEVFEGHGKMGLAVNEDIDLRIFFANWHFGFAVTSESPRGGTLYSFQFFGIDGSAIHKVFLQDDVYLGAYQDLVRKYQSEDQSQMINVQSKPAKRRKNPMLKLTLKVFVQRGRN